LFDECIYEIRTYVRSYISDLNGMTGFHIFIVTVVGVLVKYAWLKYVETGCLGSKTGRLNSGRVLIVDES